MNKQRLIEEISDRLSMNSMDVKAVVETFMDIAMEEVVKDRELRLVGFGKFLLRRRGARRGRNPQTGDVIQLPETRYPAFQASGDFVKAVRGVK